MSCIITAGVKEEEEEEEEEVRSMHLRCPAPVWQELGYRSCACTFCPISYFPWHKIAGSCSGTSTCPTKEAATFFRKTSIGKGLFLLL